MLKLAEGEVTHSLGHPPQRSPRLRLQAAHVLVVHEQRNVKATFVFILRKFYWRKITYSM